MTDNINKIKVRFTPSTKLRTRRAYPTPVKIINVGNDGSWRRRPLSEPMVMRDVSDQVLDIEIVGGTMDTLDFMFCDDGRFASEVEKSEIQELDPEIDVEAFSCQHR